MFFMALRIDKKNLKLLGVLDLNSQLPATKIAKKIGLSREAVRYRMNLLKEEGLILSYTIKVDFSFLNKMVYLFYLTISGSQSQRNKFQKHLTSINSVYSVEISEGSWDLAISILADNHNEFSKVLEECLVGYENMILKRTVALMIFEKNYSYFSKEKFKSIKKKEPIILDSLDEKILNILFINSREKIFNIVKKTSSTLDIIRYRLKKLVRLNLRYTINVDYHKLNLMPFRLFLKYRKINSELEKKIITFCELNKNIISYRKVIADWNAEIDVVVKNLSELYSLTNLLREDFKSIILDTESAHIANSLCSHQNIKFGGHTVKKKSEE